MAEIKTFNKTAVRIGKEKGVYTGEAIPGLRGATPEGYGELFFDDKKIMLRGQFKNGSFVNGDAITPTATFHGSFDDFTWLGGSDGVVEYENGSFIKGKINPKTKDFEISEMRVIDSVYGDVFEAEHVQDATGQMRIFGKQELANGSYISGDIVVDKINRNVWEQTEQMPKFRVISGNCHLNIQEDSEQKVEISGKYSHKARSQGAKIEGIFSYKNSAEEVTLTSEGEFSFVRKSTEGATTSISEMFGEMAVENGLGSEFDLTLREGGKLQLTTKNGSFCGKKMKTTIQNGQVGSQYYGTMTKKNRTFSAEGIFDNNLVFQNGEITLNAGAEIFKFMGGAFEITQPQMSTLNYLGAVSGSHQTKTSKFDGDFTVGVAVTLDNSNIVKSAGIFAKPDYARGHIVLDALENGLNFEGDYSKASGYKGRLENSANGDYKEGDFDKKMEFLKGKFRRTYDNNAVFEGSTSNLTTAKGTFGRAGDFKQIGDFEFDDEFNPIFVRGNLAVRFDDEANSYCEGRFDRDGIKISGADGKPLFGDNTYLLSFKNDRLAGCEAVSGKDLIDAYTKFSMIAQSYVVELKPQNVERAPKAEEESDKAGEVEDKSAEVESKKAEVEEKQTEEVAKEEEVKTEEHTALMEKESKQKSDYYTDIVEIAGEKIDTSTTKSNAVDISLAQSMMSRIINPNKDTSQEK